MFDITIIGNGASAVAILKTLLQQTSSQHLFLNICIVGERRNMGYGFAYHEDNDCALMNTSATNISINNEVLDFIFWSRRNGFNFGKYDHPTRRVYGRYLHDHMNNLIQEPGVLLLDARAADIEQIRRGYMVSTVQGKKFLTKRIILCTGAFEMNDFYGLSQFKNYLNHPYPLHKKLSSINSNDHLLIIGSGLTAVDICVYLSRHQHCGKIYLYSRRGQLPAVKLRINTYTPKWCRYSRFKNMAEKQQAPLTLRQVIREIRRELKSVGAKWIDVFFCQGADNRESLVRKMNEAK